MAEEMARADSEMEQVLQNHAQSFVAGRKHKKPVSQESVDEAEITLF